MGYNSAGLFGPQAVFNQLGEPLTSTAITVLEHGTDTLQPLYTDYTKGTSASNPVNTDSFGNLSFYTTPGLVDLQIPVGDTTVTLTVEVLPWSGDLNYGPAIFGVGEGLINIPASSDAQWKIQCGSTVGTTNSSGQFAISFPTAFPGGLATIAAHLGDVPTSNANFYIDNSYTTLSGFTVQGVDPANGDALGSGDELRINWVAIGY